MIPLGIHSVHPMNVLQAQEHLRPERQKALPQEPKRMSVENNKLLKRRAHRARLKKKHRLLPQLRFIETAPDGTPVKMTVKSKRYSLAHGVLDQPEVERHSL